MESFELLKLYGHSLFDLGFARIPSKKLNEEIENMLLNMLLICYIITYYVIKSLSYPS